jgi:predicted nucleic acid-binding protein
MKPRVLVDTSTLVSAAFRADSNPHKALRKALAECELRICAQTLAELETVLARPRFLKFATAEALLALVDLVRSEGRMFDVSSKDEAKVAPRC